MTSFHLHRVAIRADGAFGVLMHDGLPFAVTLERTYDRADASWRALVGSTPNPRVLALKIPVGTWECRRSFFHKGGYLTYEIFVPGHSRLLFHKGNVEEDSDGCVLVAESFGELGSALLMPAIVDSAQGFAEFIRRASNLPPQWDLKVTERQT